MLNETKYMQNFYYQQNIQLRKQIRQLDMQYRQIVNNKSLNKNSIKQQQLANQQINFFVIGPQKSGKSSLLKTIYFALNSHNNIQVNMSQLPMTIIKRYDIKKNKKYNIEGLIKMKQSDQKRTITGYQFQSKVSSYSNKQISSQQKINKIFQKYSHAVQIIDNKVMGCFNISSTNSMFPNNVSNIFSRHQNINTTNHLFNIKTVIIVLSIVNKIQFEQISCMKFFLSDIREKGIKTLVLLTHIDKLNKIKQNDKLILIEQRIQMLKKQLDIKDRDDFICVQNYQQKCSLNQSNKHTYQNKRSSFANIPYKQTQVNSHNLHAKNINQVKYGPYKNMKSNNFNKNDTSETQNGQFIMDVPIITNKYLKTQNSQKINKNYPQISFSNNLNNNQFNYLKSHVQQQNTRTIRNYRQPIFQDSHNKQVVKKQSTKKQAKNHLQIQSFYSERDLQKSKKNTQNTQNQQYQAFNNKQQINYYALKLLIRIIKENQKYNKQMKNKKLKWFCG